MDAEWQAKSAKQANDFQLEREAAAVAVINWQDAEQARRRAIEDQLQANDKTHHQELTNAQATQARLRDRLATSDLRLSVLLAAPGAGSGCGVPAASSAGGMVHGAARGELDPAAAQRIVAIADAGDQGLIALQACQGFVRALERESPQPKAPLAFLTQ
ncbi:lysis system i-spanin subunit Rz [Pseudomonas sp. RC2C2]|uniref:lysis system i-spanin subunit Rz n=1 Tax=Pseudomonas sp. RC2C2 TaxID=2834408 RepID=UPI001BCBB691|nr:lysis system i-spanin subunit Rz [Pseudomonas sp. RC2C2]MBS7601077.1 lysis protein [Pseudomonas sp. RC2C2]